MILSSLVITLTPDPLARARALAILATDPRLQLGEAVRDRLPVVAEASSPEDGATLCEVLATQDGVVRVDVVAIDFLEDA
jgi:hypothetical protein